MPLPEPTDKEKEQKFISRCIQELTETEKDRFPNHKQRVAICYKIWKNRQEKNKS